MIYYFIEINNIKKYFDFFLSLALKVNIIKWKTYYLLYLDDYLINCHIFKKIEKLEYIIFDKIK